MATHKASLPGQSLLKLPVLAMVKSVEHLFLKKACLGGGWSR